MDVQCQIAFHENIHTYEIIWTEQTNLGIYLYVYTYMQVITINEIETMSLNVSREGYMG